MSYTFKLVHSSSLMVRLKTESEAIPLKLWNLTEVGLVGSNLLSRVQILFVCFQVRTLRLQIGYFYSKYIGYWSTLGSGVYRFSK